MAHYPPGTSKWNKIEHLMFSFITQNWRGRPALDTRTYATEVDVSDEQLAAINLRPSRFHGDWNYAIG